MSNGLPISLGNDSPELEVYSDRTLEHNPEIESTALLETLIDLAPDPVFITDPQGNLTDVNAPACQLLGYTREELIGKKLADLMASDQMSRSVARPLQSETWTYRHKNGSLIPTRVNAKTLPDGRWVAFVREERDRKRVDTTLQNQAEKLRLALDFGQIGSWDWDLQTNQVEWDKIHFALLGLTPETATATYNAWRSCVHPDDVEDVETVLRTALGTQTTYEAGYRVVHPDGSLRWLIGRGRTLYDDAGQPVRMIGVLMDITERKRAEQLLQKTEQRFTTLSQASPVAIFQMNAANECIYVNAHWSEMTGQPAAVALGMGWVETLHPDDRDRLAREWGQWVQTACQQGLYQNEARVMRPDGSTRWFHSQALAIMDADVITGYIGTLTDITGRKQAEQEREQLVLQEQAARQEADHLNQLNRLKDEFLSTVSHELRSPMANIKMATKMLETTLRIEQVPTKPTAQALLLSALQTRKVRQYLDILDQECRRELSLINDLLDLARLDAGTTILDPTQICLQAWIPAVTEPFIQRMQQQQQQLEIDISPDLPPLMTDLPSLERIISELVHNACKYTPPSEIIQITVAASSNQTEIKVSNSGVEIPVEMRDRIFDKFYRIPHNDPWKHGGTGLGLALVKKLVELLRGSISVNSQQNCTQFTVALPMLAG